MHYTKNMLFYIYQKQTKGGAPLFHKKIVLSTSAILTIIIVIHFAFTFIYLSPANSFRYKHWNQIESYMSPLFTQNWKLFAPNPVNRHENIQVRFKYTNPQGKTVHSDWKAITLPIVKALQKNHFSPNARISGFASSVSHDFVWRTGDRKKTAQRDMKIFVQKIIKNNPTKFQVNGKIDLFQIRVEVNEFPRFNKRELPDSKGTFSYYYTIWFPIN